MALHYLFISKVIIMAQPEEYLFQAIKIIAESMSLPFDQTKRGRVTKKLDNGRYKVRILDNEYTIKSQFNFDVNESVLVLFPCGDTTDLYLYPNK